MDDYYLASLKLSGWLSRTSQYTTDVKEARKFTLDDALALARKHKEAGRLLVPVLVAHVEALG